MRAAALILVFLAGLALCIGGCVRLVQVIRRRDGGPGRSWLGFVWASMLLLTGALLATIVDGRHLAFICAVLGAWSALASALFLARFMTGPSLSLLALPAGAVALLVAPAWGTGRVGGVSAGEDLAISEGGWIVWLHVLFMSTHIAAALVTAASAAIWTVTRRHLKQASATAFHMPALPRLELVIERGLIVAAALLIGGLATGGAAAAGSGTQFDLWHTTPILALVDMALLMVVLAMHATQRLNRSSMRWGAMALCVIAVCLVLSLMLSDPHGR